MSAGLWVHIGPSDDLTTRLERAWINRVRGPLVSTFLEDDVSMVLARCPTRPRMGDLTVTAGGSRVTIAPDHVTAERDAWTSLFFSVHDGLCLSSEMGPDMRVLPVGRTVFLRPTWECAPVPSVPSVPVPSVPVPAPVPSLAVVVWHLVVNGEVFRRGPSPDRYDTLWYRIPTVIAALGTVDPWCLHNAPALYDLCAEISRLHPYSSVGVSGTDPRVQWCVAVCTAHHRLGVCDGELSLWAGDTGWLDYVRERGIHHFYSLAPTYPFAC